MAAEGYATFFVIATALGLPAIALAIWISRDRELVPAPLPRGT